MNPLLVGTLFFNCRGFGWSESYPLIATTYAQAGAAIAAILTARLNMLATDVTCVYGRVSDLNVRGDSSPVTILNGGVGTYPGPAGTITGDSNTVELIRFQATNFHRSVKPVRALPSDCFINTTPTLTAAFVNAQAIWGNLVEADCSIATRIKPTPAAPPYYTFTAITSWTGERFSHRKVGRPFGFVRGRRLIA